jgi:hypothetical protein
MLKSFRSHWIPIDQWTLTVTTASFGWPDIVMLNLIIIFAAVFGGRLRWLAKQ